MDSMENWLGFSLSHQEIPNKSEIVHNHQLYGEEEDCDNSSNNLHLPPPFGINHFNNSNHSQDWDTYKNNSEMSSFIMSDDGRSNSCNNNIGHHQVKLENLLGGVGGRNSTFTTQQYSHVVQDYNNILHGGGGSGGGDGIVENINNTNIGLSMINNWLRTTTAASSSLVVQQEEEKTNVVGTNAQSLSLSMSTGGGVTTQSDTAVAVVAVALPLMTASSDGGESSTTESNGMRVDSQSGLIEAPPIKPVQTFGQRTSIYRGVTRHRWTGRYEAHLWDNSCRREGQTRKGRQVYLGGYDKEEKAARSYDLAALKYWGTATTTNFPFSDYEKELEVMKNMTRQEYVASLRRKSSGFSRGASIYRGVTRHHQHGRWQARIGRVAGNKDLYLGTFSTQEEAAEAYDVAAIKFRGLNAVTNFEINRYDVNGILESSTLPIGGAAKRLKDANNRALQVRAIDETESLNSRVAVASNVWPSSIAFPIQAQPLVSMYPYNTQQMQKQQQQQLMWCKQEYDSSDHVNHSFQDLHYGNAAAAAHNFFQQPSHVLHNLMSLDSSSFEHLHNANAAASPYQSVGYGISNGYNVLPIAEESVQNQVLTGYENMFGSSDPYQTRNMYYQSQHSSNELIPKASLYDQGSSCDNWMTNVVSTDGNIDDCHEASTFTVWNDA